MTEGLRNMDAGTCRSSLAANPSQGASQRPTPSGGGHPGKLDVMTRCYDTFATRSVCILSQIVIDSFMVRHISLSLKPTLPHEQELTKKGRSIMFDKLILILIGSVIMLGAAMIAIPVPLLWGLGCLIFLALSVFLRPQQQG